MLHMLWIIQGVLVGLLREFLVLLLLRSAANDTACRLEVCGHIRAHVRPPDGARPNLDVVGNLLRVGCGDDGDRIIPAPCRPLLLEGVLEAALEYVSLAAGDWQDVGDLQVAAALLGQRLLVSLAPLVGEGQALAGMSSRWSYTCRDAVVDACVATPIQQLGWKLAEAQ